MNKLVRPVRRSLGVLMAIALCLGTSAIWGSPAQAGDVTPGPIKTSSNFELTQLSIVQTVRDAGGKLVPAGEDKTMQVYHTARLSFDWKAPSPAKKGMSFTVSLPETLRGIVGKLTFEYTTCDITADGATMKCVLNDKADGLNQVSGHIDLALDVKKATREKTATVKIDGKAVPIDLPGPGGINPEPSKPTGTRKDGWQVTSDMKNRPNAVNWRIFFSGKTSYEIVDSRVGNNAFIRWWCVKGQDANVAEGRYGEGGVRPAGTLNVKKKSDGTSIANTDPMNRSGLLHEGIVITPPALDYACGIDIIDWDALSSGGVAVNKTDNTAIINGRQYGATAIRKQSGGGSDQGYPYPHIDIVKKDAAGNDANTDAVELAGKNLDAQGVGSTDLKFTVKNDSSVEDLKQVVVTDTTSGSGTVESMACTFPGEKAPTAGVYDAGSKKWTVKWDASWKDADPAAFAAGASFPCTAKLTGVTADQVHTDTSSVEGVGYGSGKNVNAEDPYKAKVPPRPSIDIEKADESGRDADTAGESAMLPNGSTRLSFTVRNTSGEAEKNVVVKDVVAKGGKVSNLSCTFPDGSTASDPQGAQVRWEKSFAAQPAVFAKGASFTCSADLSGVPVRTGESGSTHQDTASVEADGAISGLHTSDTDPYNAHRPPEPKVKIVKKDAAGNDADTEKDAVALPGGQTDLVFDVRNPGPEALHDIVVSDTTSTESGTVESMQCTFPGENAPTKGVYDAGSKKWTVKWAASFGDKSTLFRISDSFACTAKLTGVTKVYHTDTAKVTGTGSISAKGVTGENPYNALPKNPNVEIVKKDVKGRDADKAADAAVLAPDGKTGKGAVDLDFTVVNNGGEALKQVVVTDTTTTSSGTVESMACTFPGEKAPTAGVYDAASKKWTVKWDASFAAQKPSSFAIGASFKCTAHLSGVTGDVHTDDATIAGVGIGSGKSVSDENPYNARVPGKPNVDIEKVDAKGNDADTVAESVLLPQGKTDLVFTIVNTGNESLRAIEVTDKATGSGKVSDLTCTFPDGTKGTRWETSFAAQNPARLAIGGSFTCTAKLTGVEAGKKHADTATVTGTGFVSGTGVTDSDGYHAHRSPDPTPKPTPSHPGEPTPSKSTPVTPKTAKPKPKLPRTGADVRLLGVVALGLAAAGGVVVAVRRGRKSGDGEA